jgi:uncharacterized protein involved in exopolysaccharide biosynthesis
MLSLSRIWQILLKRRSIVALCVAFCLTGVVIASVVIPPIWVAHAQVLLNVVKPDPVTGEVAATNNIGAYVSTQVALITDYAVTGAVVDALNLESDPNFIQGYQNRGAGDQRDFRTWAADVIAKNIKVKPVKDSSILDIAYTGNTASGATAIANEVLKAYIKTAVSFRNQAATQNANFYEGELTKLKAKLDEALAAEAAYERSSGLVMTGTKVDVDSERLQSLAMAGNPLVLPPALADSTKSSELELAGVNAQIAAASKTLGPNNPQMQELMRRKAGLETLVAKDEAAVRAADNAAQAGGGNSARQLAAQKQKVLADSDKIGRLQTLEQDVEQRRNDYQSAALKFATYRAQADQTSSTTYTPLYAHTPDSPLFPNWLLGIGGAIVLGSAMGCMLAVLLEILNRRVRVVEDLEQEFDEPVLGVIPAPTRTRARARTSPPRATRGARAAAETVQA